MVKEALKKIYYNIKKPIVFLDLETTGLSIVDDEIVQLYLYTYDGFKETEFYKTYSVKRIIPEEATAIHGIKNEDLVGLSHFSEDADFIYKNYFTNDDTVICGFNSNHFDLPFFAEKFIEYGITEASDLMKLETCDVYKLYLKLYPNKLVDIYKRMVKSDIGDAHDAKWDVHATIEVLDEIIASNPGEIYTEKVNKVDVSGLLKKDKGTYYFTVGKYKDIDIMTINKSDLNGYLNWFKNDPNVSKHSKSIFTKIQDNYINKPKK